MRKQRSEGLRVSAPLTHRPGLPADMLSAGATTLCPFVYRFPLGPQAAGLGQAVYPSVWSQCISCVNCAGWEALQWPQLFLTSTPLWALGRLGKQTGISSANAKSKAQVACVVSFLVTFYFENVKPNRRAKNLRLESQLLTIFATFVLSCSLLNGFAESFESELQAA